MVLLPARTRRSIRPAARFNVSPATTGQELKEQVAERLAAPLDSFAMVPAQPGGSDKSGSKGGRGSGRGSALGHGLLADQGVLPGTKLAVRLLYLGARPGEDALQAVVCDMHGWLALPRSGVRVASLLVVLSNARARNTPELRGRCLRSCSLQPVLG